MSAKAAFAVKCSLAVLQSEIQRGDQTGESVVPAEPVLPLTGELYLWTFTTPDVVDLEALAYRWSLFIKRLKRLKKPVKWVRVFEPHQSHGYHVHCLAVSRYDVRTIRKHAEAVGFGRLNVLQLPASKAGYVTKYLRKHRRKPGEKFVRLWACCGFKGITIAKTRISDSWRDWCIRYTVGYAQAHKYSLKMLHEMGLKEWLRHTYLDEVQAGDQSPETVRKAGLFRFSTEANLTPDSPSP